LTYSNLLHLFLQVLDDPEDDNIYMAFEYLEGGEIIHEIPTDKPLEEKSAWLAMRDILLGLEYLHYQKIIHR
jgi:serine/threonine protein kinase